MDGLDFEFFLWTKQLNIMYFMML